MPKSVLRKSKANKSTIRRIERLYATGWRPWMSISPRLWLGRRAVS
jgi:hypothetical protein